MNDLFYDPYLKLYLPLWQLDGDSFIDRSAYGHLCTVTGALWRPDGRIVDGVDDRIGLGNPAAIVDLTQGTTIAWFKRTGATTSQVILGYGGGDVAAPGLYNALEVRDTASNFYLANLVDEASSVDFQGIRNATPIAADTWYCGAISSDGSTWRVFLNGNEETATIWIGTLNTGDFFGDVVDANIPSPALTIGALLYDGAYGSWLAGTIGEVWIYSRVLTAAEIQNIYLRTKWRYQ